ncbi:MAG: methionine biosynthesis protein MetW [Proteobacteria bacterium]|nr:methionine biosynthesis protein MetW [Pseudomonadota bacterium]MBU1685820.1 methionine biosynthesis protein MetW [Pseudomonadota bacterium]
MRYDLQIIASWIEPGSRVLDLGCGHGDLLNFLKEEKQVSGTGIENSEELAAFCIERGLQVLQGDINEEILDYQDNWFDYVILSQTLQQVYRPDWLLNELLRIGGRVIVSFPNFSHWSIRIQLLLKGYAPKNPQLPFDWYNTPNIRVITIKDFRRFIRKIGCRLEKEVAIDTSSHDLQGKIISFLPNLRATYGIFLVSRTD